MKYNNEFSDISELYCNGNKYSTIQYIAEQSRKFIDDAKPNGGLSGSDAIDLVLDGYELEDKLQYKSRNIEMKYSYIDSIIDNDVKQSVINSIKRSLSEHKLIYHYLNWLDDFQKSRVRILTKLELDFQESNIKF